MSDCSPCTPVNPCYNCGCQESCNCPTPIYTNEGCPNGIIGSNCVTLKNSTEPCVGIFTNTTTLTSFVDKIITYVKNVRTRFISTDGSLSITPITDICNDKANIKVNIDPDPNNQIKLKPNGLFVQPISGGGAPTLQTVVTAGDTYTQTNANFTDQARIQANAITTKLTNNTTGIYERLSLKSNSLSFTNRTADFSTDLSVYLFFPKLTDGYSATNHSLTFSLPPKPSGNYILPITVNGILADSTGNITIGTGGTPQDLTGVTTVGNITPNSMIIDGNFKDMTVMYDTKSIALKVQQVRSLAKTFLEYNHSTAITKLNSTNRDLGKIVELFLPNTVDQADYTLAVSVNGIPADLTGNITIPTGGGTQFPQGLLDYIDDAAAATGGILINSLYRTGGVVKIRVI